MTGMNAHPLKAYRAAHRLTQGALAHQLGVERETLARWETGVRKPDVDRLASIAALTGIPARELRPDLAELIDAEGKGATE